ncbi:hypothetical protein F506_07240 [Herbaspirillum hiltneri N3]|uniref:Cobalt transporter subunit CbtB n=1 Tax=Herbaspirillum hiltneri N3 TaxID=1262470 RepID=A0ABN4HU07_9BURK|nr:cation efflux protein, CzcI family [Herbaspirillum hiltneri]AKZ62498.1 hypothetical protein F506_07240 [Herbaspirillum hiltneri N3]
MKRYALIFLLMLLPFQFSWAAVASYCQHESDPVAQHVGHHAAADSKQDQQPDNSDDSKFNTGSDADCSFCHFSCSKPMNSHAAWTPPAQEKSSFTPSLLPLYLSHIGESPEEPDWMLAA